MVVQLDQDMTVGGWIGDYEDRIMVLGGGTDHGWSANVDVLNGVFQGAVRFSDGVAERIQVDERGIDRLIAFCS